MTNTFRDHFSGHAGGYAAHRPGYPDELFAALAALAPARGRAWDCATGTGQAAVGLAPHFARIDATDASAAQIEHATPRERVYYRVAPADASGLDASSIDLVTVAQALHWFDLDAFYGEARRVLRPRGVLAAWCYNLCRIEPEIDLLVRDFYTAKVGAYWPPERRILEQGYATLPFPFERLPAPPADMHVVWTLADFLGYVRTWSSVARYAKTNGEDPVLALTPALRRVWGDADRTRTVRWPLAILLGRV
jgi:SAM-dependent methyltransferase